MHIFYTTTISIFLAFKGVFTSIWNHVGMFHAGMLPTKTSIDLSPSVGHQNLTNSYQNWWITKVNLASIKMMRKYLHSFQFFFVKITTKIRIFNSQNKKLIDFFLRPSFIFCTSSMRQTTACKTTFNKNYNENKHE